MSSPSIDVKSARLDPAVGAACAERVWSKLRRVLSGPDPAAADRLAEARATLAALRPALEAFARHETKKLNRAESSTTLVQLENALGWIERARSSDGDDDGYGDEGEPPRPSPAIDPAELEPQEIALALNPPRPLATLADGLWDARFLRFVEAPWWDTAAVVALDGAAGRLEVWVWRPGEITGVTRLAGARIVRGEDGLTLIGAGGRLAIDGFVDVEPDLEDEKETEPRSATPGRPDLPAWVALVDRMNQRARWDYEIEAWEDGPDGAIALRGRSGVYEPGCAIRFIDVSWLDLAWRFSHATFRLVEAAALPAEAISDGAVGVRIESDAGGFRARMNMVVARRVIFDDEGVLEAGEVEDGGGAGGFGATPVVPLAQAFARHPDRDDVRGAIAQVLDRDRGVRHDAFGLALDAAQRSVCIRGAETALSELVFGDVLVRTDQWIVETLIGLLEARADLAPGVEGPERIAAAIARLAGPIAPAPERDAATRAARAFLLDLLPSVAGEARARVEADLALLPDAPPSPRIVEDAHMEAAAAAVRHALDRPEQDIALALENVSVGRVLVDGAAEAEMSEEERLAHAASLVALAALRGDAEPRLVDLLPDPATRARFAEAESLVRSLAPHVTALAEELCERGRLDAEEISLIIAGEREALRLYRLLLAVLLGSPIARADDTGAGG